MFNGILGYIIGGAVIGILAIVATTVYVRVTTPRAGGTKTKTPPRR